MNNKPANQNGNEADTASSRSEIKIAVDELMEKMVPELKAVIDNDELSDEAGREKIEAIRERFTSQ